MAVFNIYGMCILRDLFSLVQKNDHTVQKFLQWSNLATNFVYNTKPLEKLELKHFGHDGDKPNFKERCVINDYNHTGLDFFDKESDFFLLDLVTLVHTDVYKEIQSDGSEHYFTMSKALLDLLDSTGLRENFFKDRNYTRVPALDILESAGYENVIDAYVKWLLEDKGYKPEQIILIENRSIHHWTDGNCLYEMNSDFHIKNDILKLCYRYFKKKCPGCHVIKFPCNVYGDYYHRWGLSDLHYCIEYYEYLYDCIDAIATKENSRQIVDDLYEEYSALLMQNIWKLIRKSFEYKSNENLLRGSFALTNSAEYYAPKGKPFYSSINSYGEKKHFKKPFSVVPYGHNNFKFTYNSQIFYVRSGDCRRGVFGSGKTFCGGWITVNNTTELEILHNSVILRHNGIPQKFQANIIQTVENFQELAGKPVVFSVLARVLKTNSEGRGGIIALINANDYNNGSLMAQRAFNNTEWERVFVSARLPEAGSFRGLTVCLRSLVTSDCDGAEVEFMEPKLEIGSYPSGT